MSLNILRCPFTRAKRLRVTSISGKSAFTHNRGKSSLTIPSTLDRKLWNWIHMHNLIGNCSNIHFIWLSNWTRCFNIAYRKYVANCQTHLFVGLFLWNASTTTQPGLVLHLDLCIWHCYEIRFIDHNRKITNHRKQTLNTKNVEFVQ